MTPKQLDDALWFHGYDRTEIEDVTPVTITSNLEDVGLGQYAHHGHHVALCDGATIVITHGNHWIVPSHHPA